MNETRSQKPDAAGIAVAAVLLLLAGLIVWDALSLRIVAVYGVGPKAMPYVVAAGLFLLSIGNFIMGLRGDLPAREPADLTAILRIIGGLAALMAVIGFGGGFIIATALLFAMTSSAFRRSAFHIDIAIGLVLGLIAYLLFTKLLALALPAGPLENLL